ncbi:MAG: GNAT family N-acetyltransferase [Pseudomonadota bacterium]
MLDASTLEISIEAPTHDDSRTLIEDSNRSLAKHYSKEECFSFSAEELSAPNVEFFVARRGGRPVGCVALVDHLTYGEVKRLFVAEAARGVGVGAALMAALEDAARDIGLRAIRLETGDRLAAAMAIYTARGYRERGAFGSYPDLPTNTFLEKTL